MTADLEDIDLIRQLKARYFRTMDQKDWPAYRGVFAEEAVIDTTDDNPPFTEIIGREAFIEMTTLNLEGAITVHHGHMSEIEITGADTARGIWAMEDHIWFSETSGRGKLWGAGWYEELYRRIDGEWKIERMRLRRQRIELGGVQIFPRTCKTEANGLVP